MDTNKPSMGYWLLSTVALLWNLMGVLAYLSQAFMTEDMKAALTPEQIALIESTPSWLMGIYAVATFGGLLGAICLLLRKKWAIPAFLISLIAVVIQMGYSFAMTDASEIYGMFQGVIMPILVIVIAFFLYGWSKKKDAQGILT
ncbi:hypothetical protein [Aquimarina rhabdastrellae]